MNRRKGNEKIHRIAKDRHKAIVRHNQNELRQQTATQDWQLYTDREQRDKQTKSSFRNIIPKWSNALHH